MFNMDWKLKLHRRLPYNDENTGSNASSGAVSSWEDDHLRTLHAVDFSFVNLIVGIIVDVSVTKREESGLNIREIPENDKIVCNSIIHL